MIQVVVALVGRPVPDRGSLRSREAEAQAGKPFADQLRDRCDRVVPRHVFGGTASNAPGVLGMVEQFADQMGGVFNVWLGPAGPARIGP